MSSSSAAGGSGQQQPPANNPDDSNDPNSDGTGRGGGSGGIPAAINRFLISEGVEELRRLSPLISTAARQRHRQQRAAVQVAAARRRQNPALTPADAAMMSDEDDSDLGVQQLPPPLPPRALVLFGGAGGEDEGDEDEDEEQDVNMEEPDEDEQETAEEDEDEPDHISAFEHLMTARSSGFEPLDDATAAGLFGTGFRTFGNRRAEVGIRQDQPLPPPVAPPEVVSESSDETLSFDSDDSLYRPILRTRRPPHSDEEPPIFAPLANAIAALSAPQNSVGAAQDMELVELWQTPQMLGVVLDYLVSEGYTEAAKALCEESGVAWPHSDQEVLEQRVRIIETIQAGRIADALQQINTFVPAMLADQPEVHFGLRVQHLIELIRNQQTDVALAYAATELVDEKKQLPPQELNEIERVLALLAFDKLEASPFADLLSQAQREKVASATNVALLRSLNRPPASRIEMLLKMIIWSSLQTPSLRGSAPESVARQKFGPPDVAAKEGSAGKSQTVTI